MSTQTSEQNDEQIERMIEEVLEAVEEDMERFTEWEVEFVESIEEQNDLRHLTDLQTEKLCEIWTNKVMLV